MTQFDANHESTTASVVKPVKHKIPNAKAVDCGHLQHERKTDEAVPCKHRPSFVKNACCILNGVEIIRSNVGSSCLLS